MGQIKVTPLVHNIVLVAMLFLNTTCNAREIKVCTQDEATQAETEASKLDNWKDIYSSFKRFGHCDDGAISEGYSASIGRMLAYKWNEATVLYKLTVKDKDFEKFVLKHIDDTVPIQEINMIAVNAQTRCPNYARELCTKIKKVAILE